MRRQQIQARLQKGKPERVPSGFEKITDEITWGTIAIYYYNRSNFKVSTRGGRRAIDVQRKGDGPLSLFDQGNWGCQPPSIYLDRHGLR